MDNNRRIKIIFEKFDKLFPNPSCELHFSNKFELLIAVMLSPQCTDQRVNLVTQELFKSYNTPEHFAKISQEKLEKLIYSTGFYRNKAKNIIETCKMLVNNYNSQLPDNAKEMMKFPGVGRKVANVVSSIANDEKVLGVDTHIFRVANRLNLVQAKTPLEVEKQWNERYPEYINHDTHYKLILFGRYYCKSKNPLCEKCELKEFCIYNKR